MVSVDPLMLRLALVAASYVATTVPAAVFNRMLPVPRWMASLKVSTTLAPTATPVAASAWLNVLTNLPGIKNPDMEISFKDKGEKIYKEAEALANSIYEEVKNNL